MAQQPQSWTGYTKIGSKNQQKEEVMLNPERLLGQLVSGGFSGRRRRGVGKLAAGMGLLGVAMAAYEHFSEQKKSQQPAAHAMGPGATSGSGRLHSGAHAAPPAQQPGPPPPPPPAKHETDAEKSILLIQSMIAAAAADGMLDDEEREHILGRVKQANLSPEERALLQSEVNNPVDMASLVSAAQHYQIEGQVYAAALLAVEIDTPEEREYFQALAQGLGLSASQTEQIHSTLNEKD